MLSPVPGFTNASGSILDTALVMRLTADVTGGNDVDARVYLFQDDDFEFSIDPGTQLFETSAQLWPGFDAFSNNLGPTGFDIGRKNFDGPIDETRQFDFSVEPGDGFYVWARIVVTADSPGAVDAFNALTTSFTNSDGLTPAATAVPLPGALILIVPAVADLAASRRRDKAG